MMGRIQGSHRGFCNKTSSTEANKFERDYRYVEFDEIFEHVFVPEEPILDRPPQGFGIDEILLVQSAQPLQRVGQVRGPREIKRIRVGEDLVKLLHDLSLVTLLVLEVPPLGRPCGYRRRLLRRRLDRVPGALQRPPGLGERGVLLDVEDRVRVPPSRESPVLGTGLQVELHVLGAQGKQHHRLDLVDVVVAVQLPHRNALLDEEEARVEHRGVLHFAHDAVAHAQTDGVVGVGQVPSWKHTMWTSLMRQ
jgi:hypothetical protein